MSVNNISVKPINDLSSTSSLQDTDNLLAQTSGGFRKVPISQLKEEIGGEVSIDGESILADEEGTLYVNQLEFDSMSDLEDAIENDEVPDGATIYVKGSGGSGSGGTIGSYSYDGSTRGLVVTGGSTSYEYDSATRGIVIAV